MRIPVIVVALLLSVQAMAERTSSVSTTETEQTEHSYGLSAEPLWLVLGGFGAKADTRLSDSISLGVGGMYIPTRSETSSGDSQTNYRWSTYEVYVGPTLFLSSTYDKSGWYITPALGYTSATISNYGTSNLSGSLSAPELRVTGGYQWLFAKSIRLTVGGGARVVSSSDVVIKDSTGQEVYRQSSGALGGLSLDLQIGYMF